MAARAFPQERLRRGLTGRGHCSMLAAQQQAQRALHPEHEQQAKRREEHRSRHQLRLHELGWLHAPKLLLQPDSSIDQLHLGLSAGTPLSSSSTPNVNHNNIKAGQSVARRHMAIRLVAEMP